jgi:flagellar assembly factor FliW
MKNNYHSRKIRQLNRLLDDLKLNSDASEKNNSLISRIKLRITLLLKELSSVLSKRQVVHLLGSFAVVFGLAMSNSANAQNFAAPVINPFGLQPDVEAMSATLVDLDNDGDMDLIQGNYYGTISYFQNTGTAQVPAYAAPVIDPFGLDPVTGFAFVTGVDLDDDGDIDLLVGEGSGALAYFQNTGTASAPAFAAAVTNPFGLTSTYILAAPSFADIDNDGDFDLLVGEYYGAFNYFENTGTASSPNFTTVVQNPFGLSSTYYINIPTTVDLDGDGDLDLFSSESYGNFQYFENTGTVNAPTFGAPVMNPFDITATSDWGSPSFEDLDNDGDLDLLVTVFGNPSSIAYYENLTFPTVITLVCPDNTTIYASQSTVVPDLTASATASTTCSVGVVTITQSPAAGTTLQNGVNTITITATDDCSNSSDCTTDVEYINDLGVEEINQFSFVTVYPNPASDELSIDLSTVLNEVVNIELYDMSGKLLVSTNNSSGAIITVNLSGLAKGMYQLKLASEQVQVMKRISKM